MKPCETCEYRSTKKTKYETYDWCKACGCALQPEAACAAAQVESRPAHIR